MNLLADPPPQERRTISTQRLLRQQERLLRVRAVLLQRIKRLTQDAAEESPGYSIHMADAATDSFDRDLTLGLASFEQEALYEVDAALQRIADGTYGVCELTGRRIPWERLEAIPWTRYSIAAEAELETGTHLHIGLLRTVQPPGQESADESSGQDVETLSGGLIGEVPDRWSSDDDLR